MENNFSIMAKTLRMIPKDEPVTYSRLATIFEQLAEMEASKNLVQPDVIKSVCEKHEGGKMRGELYSYQICIKCGEEY